MRRSLPALLLVACFSAAAAVTRPVSVEGLAHEAEAVVRARVEARESRWAGDGRHIYTLVTLRAASVWRGRAPERIVVQVPGGELGDVGQRVDAAPIFADGEEVVLFLARDRGGHWRVHGLGLGKFSVLGREARPSLHGIAFTQGSVPAGERTVESMPIEELERRVRAAP